MWLACVIILVTWACLIGFSMAVSFNMAPVLLHHRGFAHGRFLIHSVVVCDFCVNVLIFYSGFWYLVV